MSSHEPEESIEVGEISDPSLFEIATHPSIPDGLLIYFRPAEGAEASKPQVIAFRGPAQDKLLQAFYLILFGLGATPGQEESSGNGTKKKITLH